MVIAGVQIMKCSADRKKLAGGKVSIENNTTLVDITEKQTAVKKQGAISFAFNFTANYVTEEKVPVASISVDADIFYMDEQPKTKEILDVWKKNRTVDKAILREVMNTAMDKCNLAAILLARELELPAPIPLPKIKEL